MNWLIRPKSVRMTAEIHTGDVQDAYSLAVDEQQKSKIVWIDLGDLGDLVHPDGPHEQWQDHGLGLLRTILHQQRHPDRRRLHPRGHLVGAAQASSSPATTWR